MKTIATHLIGIAALSAAAAVSAQQSPVELNNDSIDNVPAQTGDQYSDQSDVQTNANPQNDAYTAQTDEPVEQEQIEMELVTRGIYQCTTSQGKTVFVDEESRAQYPECLQIRAPHYQQVTPASTGSHAGPCSGAIVYKGSTYIFTDKEPCPIPDDIFQARTPIEANPEYYTQPKP